MSKSNGRKGGKGSVATVVEPVAAPVAEVTGITAAAAGRKVRMIDANGPLFRAALGALATPVTVEEFFAAYNAAPRTRDRKPSEKRIAQAQAILRKAGLSA